MRAVAFRAAQREGWKIQVGYSGYRGKLGLDLSLSRRGALAASALALLSVGTQAPFPAWADEAGHLIDVRLSDQRSWFDLVSGPKDVKFAAEVTVDGKTFEGASIKGRGNSTWNVDASLKKPYQIGFSKKTDLLGIGSPTKKWVALANLFDPSHLRNRLGLWIAREMGVPGNQCDTAFAWLVGNGSDLGLYLIAHKVENSKGSLALRSGDGIMCEISNIHSEQDDVLVASDGCRFLVKDASSDDDPVLTQLARRRLVDAYDQLLDACGRGDWEGVCSLADVDSIARYWLVREFAADVDACVSNVYLYQDGENDRLHAACVWDLDLAFGNGAGIVASDSETTSPFRSWARTNQRELVYDEAPGERDVVICRLFARLCDIPQFWELLCATYHDVLAPVLSRANGFITDEAMRVRADALKDARIWSEPWRRAGGARRDEFDAAVGSLASWVSARVRFMSKWCSLRAASAPKSLVNLKNGRAILSVSSKGARLEDSSFDTFSLIGCSDGSYRIRNRQGMDVYAPSPQSKGGVALCPADSVADGSAQWLLYDDGSISNKKTSLFLTVQDDGSVTCDAWSPLGAGASDLTSADSQRFSIEPRTWVRLGGIDALETNYLVVSEGWQTSDVVLLSSNDGFYDALSAAALAGAYRAPIVTASHDGLSDAARASLSRLKPSKVLIMGGEAAIHPAVERAVARLGASVERVAGEDAAMTSLESAKRVVSSGSWSKDLIIATGGSFYDALASSPVASATKTPILLANRNGGLDLRAEIIEFIAQAKPDRAFIMGGTAAVGPSAERVLAECGVGSVRRIAGEVAVETSLRIAEWAVAECGMGANGMGAAVAQGWHDALSAGPLLGLRRAPLILVATDRDGWAYDARCIDAFVARHAADIDFGYVFGGEAAMTPRAMEDLVSATA